MAPEILSYAMNVNINSLSSCFNSYLKTDIYSLGLVIWETLRCFTYSSLLSNF